MQVWGVNKKGREFMIFRVPVFTPVARLATPEVKVRILFRAVLDLEYSRCFDTSSIPLEIRKFKFCVVQRLPALLMTPVVTY